MAGRSFHMIASCSKDRQVIVWRTVLVDIMNDEVLETPQVVALYSIDFNAIAAGEVQRLRWNILGTCLATSGEHGDVRIW